MSLFIIGLMLGSCLSFFLITMLVNSKKADEAAVQFMEERERDAPQYRPVIQQSTT
jgi:hypothetical protein